ncbi:MAG: hypothetical protein JWO20_2225 [Candidatus Angelobacter sp.]|jgi:hypothetical protein|nr:hypothetical protein [Candidatus Angelobacter sp.]
MNSPYPQRRDETLDSGPGTSFYRHLLIWFFYRGNTWLGTASELLSELKAGAARGLFKFETWPETPKDVCEYLEQHQEQLRAAGLDVRLNVNSGLRMISISWVDGIRRQPPVAGESNAALPDLQSGNAKAVELKVANSAEDDSFEPAASLPDNDPDQWDQFRNVPTRFRIDEDGRRRRTLAKVALITAVCILVFAILFLAGRQWKEAWVRKPAVYGQLRSAETVTNFLSSGNAMARASDIWGSN